MKNKIVTIREHNYQLRLLSANVSSFIYFRMMGALLEFKQKEPEADLPDAAPKMTDEEKARMLCGMAVMKLSFDDLKFVNQQAIQAVSKEVTGQQGTFLPLMSDGGRWADNGEVSDDAALVTELVMSALVFSLAGYFSGSGAVKATDPATTSQ